jgi:hypothetical protein
MCFAGLSTRRAATATRKDVAVAIYKINKGYSGERLVEAYTYAQQGEYFTFTSAAGDQVLTIKAANVLTIELQAPET